MLINILSDRESLSDMTRLGLNRSEINTFFRAYRKVDIKRQDSILISDLLEYLEIDEVPLTLRAFGELDLAVDGMLNFREVLDIFFIQLSCL